ncbi:MAG: PilZ domain-containing protein [Deltaproteobacteria bacterium]|nr:PilZ domain-containing protein [Deltaproteobacteria bacterium]MBN2670624.1 PilZ domain-containing protein [Deltaproteobacteria bacterium]
MGAERRLENKRMKVAKRMEVSCLETGTSFVGETEDVSDSGIRAYLNKSPRTGAGVMVKLYWDDEQQPVETFGRVAWAAPMPAGDGIEVGFMLGAEGDVYGKKEKQKKRAATRYHKFKPTNTRQYIPFQEDWRAYDDDSIENKKTLAAIPTPSASSKPVAPISLSAPEPILLLNGESFKVLFQGRETWAKIADTEEISSKGEMHLTLQIKDKRLWKKEKTTAPTRAEKAKASPKVSPRESNDDEFDPEQWKAKPITNAYITVKKYIGPVLKVSGRILFWTGTHAYKAAHALWKRLPLTTRARVAEAMDNVKKNRFVTHLRGAARFTKHTSDRLKAIIAR